MNNKEKATGSQKRKLAPYNTKKIGMHSPKWNGWWRPWAWRPKWSLSEEGKILRDTKIAMKKRIALQAKKILNAQFTLAYGCNYLMVKRAVIGKKWQVVRYEAATIIEDPSVIQAYLDWELEDSQDQYFYVTAKTPNVKAQNDLLDRAFWKALQEVETKVEHTWNVSISNIYQVTKKIESWEEIEDAEILEE